MENVKISSLAEAVSLDASDVLVGNDGAVTKKFPGSLFATAAQGSLADSAIQPGDDASTLGSGSAEAGSILVADGSGGMSFLPQNVEIGTFTWDSSTPSPAASQPASTTVMDSLHKQMRRCIVNDSGEVEYYLKSDDSTLKVDGSAAVLDGSDGQVMVEIPKFYTKRETSGTETTWSISNAPLSGFNIHPAFIKDGVEVDYRYYGAYHASVYAPATGLVTDAAQVDPVQITSSDHGLASNCQITISGTGDAALDGNSFVITKIDDNTFSLNGVSGSDIVIATDGSWEQTYLAGLNLDDTTAILSTGTTNELASVSGVYPIVGLTRAEARSLAANRGSVWRQLDFTLWSAVQLLYLVEYQTFYSQDELGNGNTNDSYVGSSSNQAASPHSIAGRSNSLGNASTDTTSGANTVTDPPTAFMSYRGIENFYGNAWQWADGIVKDNADIYITNDRSDFSDSSAPSGHDLVFNSFPNGPDGYIDAIADVDDYFLASSVSGSSSTYVTDYTFTDSGTRIIFVGGGASFVNQAGAFLVAATALSGNAIRDIGARLTC